MVLIMVNQHHENAARAIFQCGFLPALVTTMIYFELEAE